MPLEINNIDLSVLANFLNCFYDYTLNIDSSLLDNKELMKNVSDNLLLLEWGVMGDHVLNRYDIALLYYPNL